MKKRLTDMEDRTRRLHMHQVLQMEAMANMWEKQFEDIISENFPELKIDMSLQNKKFKTTQGEKL